MSDLQPGTEMDRAVAEVLGLVIEGSYVLFQDEYYYLGKPADASDEVVYWSPSTRDNDALRALDMLQLGHPGWGWEMSQGDDGVFALLYNRDAMMMGQSGLCVETRPEAICKAILDTGEKEVHWWNQSPSRLMNKTDIKVAEALGWQQKPTSCSCGGNMAWVKPRPSGAFKMVGCVCHDTPHFSTDDSDALAALDVLLSKNRALTVEMRNILADKDDPMAWTVELRGWHPSGNVHHVQEFGGTRAEAICKAILAWNELEARLKKPVISKETNQ